jgi:hypothetical protein
MVAYLYLVRQQGEGHILNDMGFCGFHRITLFLPRTPAFLTYLTQLLENPERSGTHTFDQQRYMAAAKECLQLFLFSSQFFEGTHGVLPS